MPLLTAANIRASAQASAPCSRRGTILDRLFDIAVQGQPDAAARTLQVLRVYDESRPKPDPLATPLTELTYRADPGAKAAAVVEDSLGGPNEERASSLSGGAVLRDCVRAGSVTGALQLSLPGQAVDEVDDVCEPEAEAEAEEGVWGPWGPCAGPALVCTPTPGRGSGRDRYSSKGSCAGESVLNSVLAGCLRPLAQVQEERSTSGKVQILPGVWADGITRCGTLKPCGDEGGHGVAVKAPPSSARACGLKRSRDFSAMELPLAHKKHCG